MASKHDAAALAANAKQLETLAATARSNMLRQTTEKATRLGAEGERLARQAKAAEAQRGEAEALAKTHLADAATYEAKATSLDRQAAATTDPHDATELREDAEKQRQGAGVARSRAQIADDDAQRMAREATDLRAREQAIDAELADMGGRLLASEMAVDNLEWHAERARTMADTVGRADDLQQQANEATARGDSAAAAALTQRAASLRDDADAMAFVRGRPPFVLDERTLSDLGVELPPGTLDVPMPELIDPTSPFGPLAATSPGDGDGTDDAGAAVASALAATDDVLGLADADPLLAAASLEPGDDGVDLDADAAALGGTDVAGFEDAAASTLYDPPSDDTSSFDGDELVASSDTPSYDAPVFDTPAFDTLSFDAGSLGGGDELVASSDFGDAGSLYDEPAEPGEPGGDDGTSDMFA